MPRNRVVQTVLVGVALCAAMIEARAEGVVFDGSELRHARATLNRTPYGNVTLDLDLSAFPLRCDGRPARGPALTVSVHPGPRNRFFAGSAAFVADVYAFAAGEERASDVDLPGATLTLAPFAVKSKAVVSGRITIPKHGGGSFKTTMCPIRKVKLPTPLPDSVDALVVNVDDKPWRPAKVLAMRTLVDKKPVVTEIWFVDASHTCETPTGLGSLSLRAAAAVQHPNTMQPTSASIWPPTGDAGASGITSLAWLRLDLAGGEVRGSFAARQDAAEGARWEASGRFVAELCPVR